MPAAIDDRRHLSDLDGPLADDVTAQDLRDVARSTTSLQKPAVRPSMIVRVVESKRTTAVTTSCASRAFASVRPTCAYSGSVKLPVGVTGSPSGHRRPAHGVRRRHEALLQRRRDEQQARR